MVMSDPKTQSAHISQEEDEHNRGGAHCFHDNIYDMLILFL